MIKAIALKDFNQGGMLRFSENEVFKVQKFGETRYFLVLPKKKRKILIPLGYVRELTEEELKEIEEIENSEIEVITQ